MITNDGIVGIDFEEHVFGQKETDFGRLLAYIDTYHYEDSRAKDFLAEELARSLSGRFLLSEETLLKKKARELKEIERLRKQKCR